MRVSWCVVVLTLAALTPVVGLPQQQPRSVVLSEEPSNRRLALVIGNDAYPKVPLKHAAADAKAVAKAVQEYGFEVDLVTDTSFKDLSKSVDRFIARLKPG